MIKLNPDKTYVEKLIKAIYKNNGYCPCKLEKSKKNICPCEEFLEKKECKCKFFIK